MMILLVCSDFIFHRFYLSFQQNDFSTLLINHDSKVDHDGGLYVAHFT